MDYAYAIAELVSAAFLSVIGMGLAASAESSYRSARCLLCGTAANMLMLVLNAIGYLPVYATLDLSLRVLLTSAIFLLFYTVVFFFCEYVCAYISEASGVEAPQWVRTFSGLASLITVAIWVAILPTGLFFTFDDVLGDHPGGLVWVTQIPAMAVVLIATVLTIANARSIGKHMTASICSFFVASVAAGILQYRFGEVALFLVLALFIAVFYIMGAIDQNQRMIEQESKLAQSRLDVALSQIQPHFLYNSLNSIYHLIDLDPEQAQEVLSEFSSYLRMNLSAVGKGGLVPFSSELEHINTYLRLEKLRFGDDLNTEYRIEAKDFMVPPLSIQPLVENAVKHGVCKKEDGGTIQISSRDAGSCWEVSILDDGVGFVVGAPRKSSDASSTKKSSGIGIANVAQRLELLCNARLVVQSVPGKGTLCIVSIPKEGRP